VLAGRHGAPGVRPALFCARRNRAARWNIPEHRVHAHWRKRSPELPALPNAASEGLHRSLGFEPVGTWRRIGWKFGEWHDVLWVQRHLATPTGPPAEPR